MAPGPITLPMVFTGILPQVPPQLNEPGVTLYFAAGGGNLSSVSLVFTKPSGAMYSVAAPLVYIGKPAVSFAGGTFSGGTYVVYTFAANELDELGVWNVQLRRGSGISQPGEFRVVRNVSPS